jgi:hypothetical protein
MAGSDDLLTLSTVALIALVLSLDARLTISKQTSYKERKQCAHSSDYLYILSTVKLAWSADNI